MKLKLILIETQSLLRKKNYCVITTKSIFFQMVKKKLFLILHKLYNLLLYPSPYVAYLFEGKKPEEGNTSDMPGRPFS